MLTKLVEADPRSPPGFTWELETGSVYRFDFNVVWQQMRL